MLDCEAAPLLHSEGVASLDLSKSLAEPRRGLECTLQREVSQPAVRRSAGHVDGESTSDSFFLRSPARPTYTRRPACWKR